MCVRRFKAIHPIVLEYSIKKPNVNFMLASDETLGDHQSQKGSSSEDHECHPALMLQGYRKRAAGWWLPGQCSEEEA